MNNWHKLSVEDVSLESGTDTKMGRINIDKGRKRLSANKIFTIPQVDTRSLLKHMLSDASILLLLFTLILTCFTADIVESVSSIVLLLIAFALGCYLKFRSSGRIFNSYNLLLPVAKVTENGTKMRLSIFDVEIGDLIEFKQGDIIPADARLVTSESLKVAERSTDPVSGKIVYMQREKFADVIFSDDKSHESYPNTVYAGSMVVSGKGSAIVSSVGKETKLCSIFSPIAISQSDDTPIYLRSFYSYCKRLSLSVLIAVIPVTLVALYSQTLNSTIATDDYFNLLNLFLIALSVSVTCMSELVISPAETLITKDILPSSKKKGKITDQSRITKLSSAEDFADVDTLLILCPEVLKDTRKKVRRVYFDSKDYRLDTLESQQLSQFKKIVAAFYSKLPKGKTDYSAIAAKEFAAHLQNDQESQIVYINNFPMVGTLSRVFKRDQNKVPLDYIAQSSDISLLDICTHIRTEGGVWAIDANTSSAITSVYNDYISDGFNVSVLMSKSELSSDSVFEGLLAIGEEFPYSNGDIFAEYHESGITPILMFQNESNKYIDFAQQCGIVSDVSEIAVASQYYRSGLSISDAPADTKVYIGFGRRGTSELVARLKKANHCILPIIKDSAQRHDVLPLNVYGTHSIESHETVKLATSLSLKQVESESRGGGIADTLTSIRGSSLARIKLGAYKNYLVFAAISRLVIVAMPMILGFSKHILSAFMVLLSGFLCDYIALLSLMYSGGRPIKLKNSAAEASRLFSSSLAFLYSILAVLSSATAVSVSIFLTSSKAISLSAAPTFLMISLTIAQISALGGLLLIVRSKTRGAKINLMYLLSVLFVTISALILSFVPDNYLTVLSYVGISGINLKILPYTLPPSIIVFIGSALINKLISSFEAKSID